MLCMPGMSLALPPHVEDALLRPKPRQTINFIMTTKADTRVIQSVQRICLEFNLRN